MVKVCVYGPAITVSSADFAFINPRYWNSLFHSLIFLDRMQRIFCSCSHSHSTSFRSTWYPLLLGGQRRCGFNACPRLLHVTSAAGVESQTNRSRVQHLNHSATRVIGFCLNKVILFYLILFYLIPVMMALMVGL